MIQDDMPGEAQARGESLDVNVSMAELCDAVLTYVAHTLDRNPADPAALDALRRIDTLRRQHQALLGAEPTDHPAAAARLGISSDKPGGK